LRAIEDQQLARSDHVGQAGLVRDVLGLALFAARLGEAERRVAVAESHLIRQQKENR
jgi:hypothetical protein